MAMLTRPLILLAACAALLAAPAGAGAVAVSGPSTLTLVGDAADDLGKTKVEAKAGAAPVTSSELPKYVLPASMAVFSSARTTLTHGGSLTFSRKVRGKTRKVLVRSIEVRLGKSSELRAKVAGKTITLATLDVKKSEYTTQAEGAVVRLTSTRLTLTKDGAAALKRGLALRKLRRSGFGVLAISASAANTGSGAPGVGGTQPGGTPPPGTAPGAVPGPGGETLVPLPKPRLSRPAGAVDVSASTLRWHLRESFVRYVSEGSGVAASAGATLGPPTDGMTYDVDYTPAAGSWVDPGTGQARLLFSGRLKFAYAERGIDIQIVDPEIEINGAESRLIATFDSGAPGAYKGPGVFATLDVAAASTAGSGGLTAVYSTTPARLTEWSNQSVMSGFYPAPGNDFGYLNLGFTRAS